MITFNKHYFVLFTRLMGSSVFNAYRHDQPRSERAVKIDGLKAAILRDFKVLAKFVSVEEMEYYDEDMGRAAQLLKDGYQAWVDSYWYGATPVEIANATYTLSEEDWERDIYEWIVESKTAYHWFEAVEAFNYKRDLFGKD
jgi:hypothetical protein